MATVSPALTNTNPENIGSKESDNNLNYKKFWPKTQEVYSGLKLVRNQRGSWP